MNSYELADWLTAFTKNDVDYDEKIILKAATELRQQRAELHKHHQIVFWLQENRPDVWGDMRKASKE